MTGNAWCNENGCLPLLEYDTKTGHGTWSCARCHRPLSAEEIKALPLSTEQRRSSK